jgi:hypothetical protein
MIEDLLALFTKAPALDIIVHHVRYQDRKVVLDLLLLVLMRVLIYVKKIHRTGGSLKDETLLIYEEVGHTRVDALFLTFKRGRKLLAMKEALEEFYLQAYWKDVA